MESLRTIPTIWAVVLEGNRRLEIDGDLSLLRKLLKTVSTTEADDRDATDVATQTKQEAGHA